MENDLMLNEYDFDIPHLKQIKSVRQFLSRFTKPVSYSAVLTRSAPLCSGRVFYWLTLSDCVQGVK